MHTKKFPYIRSLTNYLSMSYWIHWHRCEFPLFAKSKPEIRTGAKVSFFSFLIAEPSGTNIQSISVRKGEDEATGSFVTMNGHTKIAERFHTKGLTWVNHVKRMSESAPPRETCFS